MWCLVNLPNKTTFGIQCDSKAIGQECLEKVCKDLGIICETEYFGLIECKQSHKSKNYSYSEWINLRNPLPQHGTNGQPYLLELKVKFWVPGHLILQDSVRNIFYMQARLDLLEGRLLASSWENAAKLGALLAQADEVRFDSTTIIAERPKKTVKTNYEQTKIGKKRKMSKQESSEDPALHEILSEPAPLLSIYENYIIRPDENDDEIPPDFIKQIAEEHSKLANLKMSAKSAKYWLLEKISELQGYGEEIFSGALVNEHEPNCKVSVGPHGIVIYKPDAQKRIPFSAATTATPFRSNFRLTYLTEEHTIEEIDLKLPRPRIAAGLYRVITEKHAFYSCETVGRDVTKQFIRDLKGTIASMFNMYTKLGKLYVFDIQRTCREVHDHARRVLHMRGIEIMVQQTDIPELDTDCENSLRKKDEKLQLEKEVSGRIAEALTCRICMDHHIDTTFYPCGHVTSCGVCAEKCERCPLCRATITAVNKIFLPTELSNINFINVNA